jgi:hypothetical protein
MFLLNTHFLVKLIFFPMFTSKKPVKFYIWGVAFYGTRTWKLRKVDQKYIEGSEMWCWRRKEKNSWTDRVRNEEALQRVKGETNILHTIKRRKANWIGHILRRNVPSKPRNGRKDRRKDISDGKTRK